MMKFVWFCAAGNSFFIGIGLVIAAICFSCFQKLYSKLIAYTLALLGAFLIFLSATPMPLWLYSIWILVILVSLVSSGASKGYKAKIYRSACIAAIGLSVVLFCLQVPYCFMPQLKGKFVKLYVIGDSVSAGIGGINEQTWSNILSKEHGIDVIDLSESGATVATAMRQAQQVEPANAIVLLEIGGNDLFAPTLPSQFKQDLEKLLEKVTDPNHLVVMLELPLQPWHIDYGRIQRQLSRKCNVVLVPKRFFVSILALEGTTLDLAHLSPEGHKVMAEKMWALLGENLQ